MDYNKRIGELESQLLMGQPPETRAEGIARKDARIELARLEKERCKTANRPGYENIMKLRGAWSKDNGM